MKKQLLLLLCLPMIGFGQGWEQTYGGTDYDWGYSVQQTTDGGYIITGVTSSFGNGNGDVYLIKTDEDGIEQWNKTFGGVDSEGGSSVQQTSDSGYIITGSTSSFGNGGLDVYLIKTDENGDSLWTRTFGGMGDDYGNSIQLTTDDGYIITGSSSYHIYLIKTDANGDSIWTKTHSLGFTPFGSALLDDGREVQQTNDGGYIITGSSGSLPSVDFDMYILKTDSNGDSLWSKNYPGAYNEIGHSIQQTADSGYVILGSSMKDTFSTTGVVDYDMYLVKTDSNGDSLWTRTFGGIDQDHGSSVKETTDGGYILCGQTLSFGNGDDDVYLVKTNSNGNITSTFNIPTINNTSNGQLIKTVDILGRETKGTKNEVLFYIYDDGTVEKRIVIE